MSKVIYTDEGKRVHLIHKGPEGSPFVGDTAVALCGTEFEISTFDNFENLPYCIECRRYSVCIQGRLYSAKNHKAIESGALTHE